MQKLQRTVAALVFPVIGWLGAACERETPTEARPPGVAFNLSNDPTRWVNPVNLMPPYTAPGTSCSDPGYPTIQDAVNDAISGDVIMVCAGPYPEAAAGPLTINKTLTLRGAQFGMDARGRVGMESIVTDPQGTYVTASNVVIDGFTVENSTNGAFTGYGILMGQGPLGRRS